MSESSRHIDEFELIGKVLSGEASAEELKQLEEWLRDSAENQKTFDALKKAHSVKNVKVNVDAAWNKLENRIGNTGSGKVVSFNQWRSIAAIFVVALGLLALLWQFVGHSEVEVLAVNNSIEITLPDGSIVNLNKGSKLSYPEEFKADFRNVKLEGEAFFDVAPNKQIPFVIHTPQEAEIKVVGTSFNVLANKNAKEVEVVVETGKVILCEDYKNTDENSVALEPGERGVYNRDEHSAKKGINVSPTFLYWLNKTLIFRKTDLGTVASTLNGIYDVNIQLKNEGLSNCKITATFKNEDLSTILTIIEHTLNVKIENRNGDIVIEGNGC